MNAAGRGRSLGRQELYRLARDERHWDFSWWRFLFGDWASMDWRTWATTTHGPAEVIGASFAFWWGFWVASPWWVVFGTSPTYKLMGLVAPDFVWGGALMAAGAGLGYCSMRQFSTAKQVMLLFLVGYFVFVTCVFAVSNIGSTAPITYLHVAGTYAWLWYTERRRLYG